MGLFKDCGCGCNGRKQQEKFVTSLISGLTFFIVANPETFRLVRRVLGSWIATPTGCPSTAGLLVHMVVFILVVWGMMNLKKEGGSGTKKAASGCGCGSKKGTKTVVSAPPQMVDAPDAEPDFGEPQLEFADSGRTLEPMDVSSDGTLFN
jgi:hypothetical protein